MSGPLVYLYGPCIRIEVAWPAGLEKDTIYLHEMSNRPLDKIGADGMWLAGMTQDGTTVFSKLDNVFPHMLVSGASGAGKSVALQSMVYQLSQDDRNQLVLIDGKNGHGLNCVGGCKNVVGPVATDLYDARSALQWTINQMEYRYEHEQDGDKFLNEQPRIIIVIDEFQEITDGANADPASIEMIRRLAVQARAARIHLVMGTQSPNMDAFGHQSTRKNLPNRVAFRVESPGASQVALGTTEVSASNLTGKGDSYCILSGYGPIRVQFAFVDREVLRRENTRPPMMEAWPVFDPEALHALPGYDVEQVATGLQIAAAGKGRPALEAISGLGSTRARGLLRVSRELWEALEERGFSYVEQDSL